jgi:hypothetical protein
MQSSRHSPRDMQLSRRQREQDRATLAADLRSSLPRTAVHVASKSEANARSIKCSIEADRWLREHGFDRWGRPAGADHA